MNRQRKAESNSRKVPLSLEGLLRSAHRALVLGIGGGGDIVGAIPTARLLEAFGVRTVLGGISWERFIYDPQPGPRSLDEVLGARPIHPVVWWANGRTRIRGGATFGASRVAAYLRRRTLLVDLSRGVAGVVEGLTVARRALDLDLIVGVDVGGDSLATGREKGLRSPLADAVMVAALASLADRGLAVLGVFGYGSDGELTRAEIDQRLSLAARHGGLLGAWGMTPEIVAELTAILRHVHTEASRLPVAAARGARGTHRIRQGTVKVELTPVASITFYLSPKVVLDRISRPARAVRHSRSLDEANDALHRLGIRTELDLERLALRRRTRTYRTLPRWGQR